MKSELTAFGFTFGPMEVTRTCELPGERELRIAREALRDG